MKTENNKVVIVGAGMAGLTAAAYLAKKNVNVLLLEKNGQTGGLMGSFDKNGFIFDSGPRALVNSGIIKPILNDLGIQWEYYENKITLGIEDHLLEINSLADLEKYQHILTELYPKNVAEIKKIVDYIRRLSEYTRILYEFDNPNFSNQMSDKSYIFKRLLPWMVKFLHAIKKLNDFNVPMEVFLNRLTSNQSLIDIITQHFFRQTPLILPLVIFMCTWIISIQKAGQAHSITCSGKKFSSQVLKSSLMRKSPGSFHLSQRLLIQMDTAIIMNS